MSTIDRFTASRGKLRLVLACVGSGLLAGVLIGVARAPAQPETSEQAAVVEAPATLVPSEAPDTQPQPMQPSAPVLNEAAEPAPELSEADVVEAHQAAADFAAAYGTYSYDDSSNALVERIRPFVTPELAAELARNSGATAGREELEARRQQASGSAFTVHTDTVGDGYVDVLVSVRQEVSWQGGAETRWPTYLLRVVRSGEGWRVSGLLR